MEESENMRTRRTLYCSADNDEERPDLREEIAFMLRYIYDHDIGDGCMDFDPQEMIDRMEKILRMCADKKYIVKFKLAYDIPLTQQDRDYIASLIL